MKNTNFRWVSAAIYGAMGLALIPGCTWKSKTESPSTVHLYAAQKVKGLDPAFTDDVYSAREVANVYEGLLQYHYLKRPYALVPNLAEAMPTMSADGKTLTFKLKKGVLFQDDAAFKATQGKGRELTAEDFVYSFKRIADPKTASPGWWIFDGKIVGLNEWRDEATQTGKTDFAKEVAGLKAVDRYTLQIQLKARSYQFLYTLAMPFAFAVPKEAVDAYDKEFLNHPVGTGPFKLDEYNPTSKLVWVRNPTYRKELYPSDGAPGDKEAGLLADAGQPLPRADKVITTVIVEQQPLWLNFLSGRLDFVEIPKDSFGQAINSATKELSAELAGKGIRLLKEPSLDITHDSFNMTDPLFAQGSVKARYLRQALSASVNIGPLIELFYNGRAIPAQGPIPPGLAGYDPDLKNPYRQFSVAKSKELLAKAGYPEGRGLPVLEYATPSSTFSRQLAEYTERSFAAIGVKLKVNQYSWPEFQQVVRNKKAQMWGFAWQGDYPDAENFLQLFYGKNVSPGPNDASYVNPEYDKLYDRALTLEDGPERTAIYQSMVKILIEDAPWIFNAHRIDYYVAQAWAKNYKIHQFEVGRAKYYRTDPALKK